jgi:vancomycin aglycone glucosyltransferase
VAALGIGAAHDGANPTRESLAAALQTALSPEVGARAADIAGAIRTDGAETAAQSLIEASSRV